MLRFPSDDQSSRRDYPLANFKAASTYFHQQDILPVFSH